MLYIYRNAGESVIVDDSLHIRVENIRNGSVKLVFTNAEGKHSKVMRSELQRGEVVT